MGQSNRLCWVTDVVDIEEAVGRTEDRDDMGGLWVGRDLKDVVITGGEWRDLARRDLEADDIGRAADAHGIVKRGAVGHPDRPVSLIATWRLHVTDDAAARRSTDLVVEVGDNQPRDTTVGADHIRVVFTV